MPITSQKPSTAQSVMQTPVGRLLLCADDEALHGVCWAGDEQPISDVECAGHAVLAETRRQLNAYFAGSLTAFSVPLHFTGTDFQKKVWQALLEIPFGQTRSYADIARAIDCPAAVRAVGAANGRNPIAILAPCHRVIGQNGTLTGFAGGLDAKRYLLSLESGQKALL